MTTENYTILVVDDEPSNIAILSEILSDNYKVTAATNGAKAIQHCFSGKIPDLILLDVIMPEMDGYAVCKTLKNDPRTRNIPILFVTAKSSIEDEKLGLELGAIDYIRKPFSPPVILQRVKNHLAMYNQNRVLDEMIQRRTKELHLSRREIISRLGTAAEFKDNQTGLHVKRMSIYSSLIAQKMVNDDQWCQQLLIASPMHDVGKIGIPDSILTKPAKLNETEWKIMKTHCDIGFAILDDSDSELLKLAAVIAKSHHEKWDGSGYPFGLAGDQIPLEGRIVAVADVFDALTSVRPYKKAWSIEDAIAEVDKVTGTHFDPLVTKAFHESLHEILAVRASFPDK